MVCCLVYFPFSKSIYYVYNIKRKEIFRGAMKGKLIVNCPLPPERIPKFQLLYKGV
ncbi:putative Thioredoxin-like superfamily [Helianthus anomalus]